MGSTYVSDPRMWKSFYKNMMDGAFHPGHHRGRQTGGGVAGMYSKKPYMIPVNPHVTKEPEEKIVVGRQVTPMTAVEDRAKSEMKKVLEDDQPHVPVKRRKGMKRVRPIKSRKVVKRVRSTKSLKVSTSKRRKRTSKQKTRKRSNPNTRKRKRIVEDANIFSNTRRKV